MERGSWLLPDGVDRERLLELDRQLRPARSWIRRVLAIGFVASGAWIGWWAVLPLLLQVVFCGLCDGPIERSRRPEYLIFGVWVGSEALTAASVLLAGPRGMAMASWLAMPVLTLGARFSRRGTALGVGISLGLLAALELGMDAGAVRANPPLLIAPAAAIICVALLQSVIVRSELRLRGEVVIDPLTGMLNRRALERRVEELQQQSQLTLQSIGLIAGDIDRFKAFNDQHGHQAADAVLADVSYRLRKTLRAFDFCYRTGGEEFLVVLPGADLEDAIRLAEKLRHEVEHTECDGLRVTMSFGVAVSPPGQAFDFEEVYGRADAALYEAKHAGRNRVRPWLAPAPPRRRLSADTISVQAG